MSSSSCRNMNVQSLAINTQVIHSEVSEGVTVCPILLVSDGLSAQLLCVDPLDSGVMVLLTRSDLDVRFGLR